MSKLILIAGLPGSGKTCLGIKLRRENPGSVFLDDPSKSGYPLEYLENFLSPDSPLYKDVVIVADLFLCLKETQEQLDKLLKSKFPEREVSWVVFENTPDNCTANAYRRNDGRNVGPDIRSVSRRYHMPEGAEVLPVWTDEVRPN